MGQFANTIFSGLLGWVQAVAASLWRLMTSSDTSAWLRWLMNNWLPLTLILCVAGVAVDLLVYLIRWQPYRVWRGFLKRHIGKKNGVSDEADLEEDERFQRRWVYADGTTSVEDLRKAAREEAAPADHLELPIRPVRRTVSHGTAEKAYYQPVYPPQWQQATKDDHSGGNE